MFDTKFGIMVDIMLDTMTGKKQMIAQHTCRSLFEAAGCTK